MHVIDVKIAENFPRFVVAIFSIFHYDILLSVSDIFHSINSHPRLRNITIYFTQEILSRSKLILLHGANNPPRDRMVSGEGGGEEKGLT